MTSRPPQDDDRVLILRLWQEPSGSPVSSDDFWRGHVYEGSLKQPRHFVGLGRLLLAIRLVLKNRPRTDMLRTLADKGSRSP